MQNKMPREAPETVLIPTKHKPGSKGSYSPYKSGNRAANGLRVDGNESKDIALWMGTTPSQDLSARAVPPTLPSDTLLRSEKAGAAVEAGEREVLNNDKGGRESVDVGEEGL